MPTPRTFSPATCLACRQPFSAQLAIACTIDPDDGDASRRSVWQRIRGLARRPAAAPEPSSERGR